MIDTADRRLAVPLRIPLSLPGLKLRAAINGAFGGPLITPLTITTTDQVDEAFAAVRNAY